MSAQSTQEKIEDYLAGILTGDELKAFEAQLAKDPALAEEVELRRAINEAIGDQKTVEFQRLVQEQGAAFLKQPNGGIVGRRPFKLNRRWFAVAASLLILVLAAYFIWGRQKTVPSVPLTEQELYAKHFFTYDLNLALRTVYDASIDEAFKKALLQYQREDFTGAVFSFRQLADEDKDNMQLAFALAQAHMNTAPPQLGPAEALLRKIITDNKSIYVPTAKWYWALILIKRAEIERAKEQLKDVVAAGGDLGKKANALLEDLG